VYRENGRQALREIHQTHLLQKAVHDLLLQLVQDGVLPRLFLVPLHQSIHPTQIVSVVQKQISLDIPQNEKFIFSFLAANGAALDLPGSLIARTWSKCKLDLRFHFWWLKNGAWRVDPSSFHKSYLTRNELQT
jgi:hypothetical protein